MAHVRLAQLFKTVDSQLYVQLLSGCRWFSRAAYQNPFERALPDTEQEPQLDFYDTTVEAFASKSIQTFSLAEVRIQSQPDSSGLSFRGVRLSMDVLSELSKPFGRHPDVLRDMPSIIFRAASVFTSGIVLSCPACRC